MNGLIIGLYGIYIILVGFQGNSKQLLNMAEKDAPGFLPWALSIGVLAVAYNNEYTKKVAEPFIFLLILSFILMNFETLKREFDTLYSMAGGGTGTTVSVDGLT